MVRMNPITLQFSGDLERDFNADYFRKSLTHVRFAILSGLFLFAAFGYMDGKLVWETRHEVWLIRYAIVCPFLLLSFFLTFSPLFKRYMQPMLFLTILVPGLGVLAIMVVSPRLGDFYYGGLMMVIIYAFTFIRLRFWYATFCALTIMLAYQIVSIWINHTPFLVLLNNDFQIFSANYIGMFVAYLLEYQFRKDYLHDVLLEIEQDKSNKLMLNILPALIADRLKQGEELIVDSFAQVTVLFADIVGFTKISARISPEEVVTLMNEVFSTLDRLVEKHGLEKIKTIGDAYMLAGGLPLPRHDHAEAVAEMALDMLDALNNLDAAKEGWLRLRIGFHTGPVVAGVIGTKKFVYDLWGDTVNIASRMESHGIAGCIQVTQAAYEKLQHGYLFQERGTLEIKGKGEMNTYLLMGRKSQITAKRDELGSQMSSIASAQSTAKNV